MTAKRSAVVTGATGFIGRNLVRHLVDEGYEVTCLLRPQSQLPVFPRQAAEAFSNVRIFRVSSWDDAQRAGLHGADHLFHLAAAGISPADRDPATLIEANVGGARAVTRLAARLGASLVMAGSSAEYADPIGSRPLAETAPLQDARLYGRTKAQGSKAALAAARDLDVPAAICRLFNVYGPGEGAHRLFPMAMTSLARGKRLPMSAGTQVRDFIGVADACSAMLAVARWQTGRSERVASDVFNICTGAGRTVLSFAQDICRRLGADEALLGVGDLPLRPDDVPLLVGDPCLIAETVGWRARAHDEALAGEMDAFEKGL